MVTKFSKLKKFAYKDGKSNLVLLLILNIFFIGFLVFYSSWVLADMTSSRELSDGGFNCGTYTGNLSGCLALSSTCNWGNNSGAVLQDPWCYFNSSSYNLSTVFPWSIPGKYGFTYNNISGGLLYNAGCCVDKPGSGSGSGGVQTGCWSYDGNRSGCFNSTAYGVTGCLWKPNNANQNPMCYVKEIGDWASGKQVNNINDIGCCERQGCWSYGGDQSTLGANNCTNVLGGVCIYAPGGSGGCPDGSGCCWAKSCSEVSTQSACEQLTQIDMPCEWNQSGSNACQMRSGGGFNMYNDTDSCMSKGGWWNSSSSCAMPGGFGGGGFMYAQEARCWFADQRANVCGNVTGCVYCSNATTQINNASSACYLANSGACKGHEPLSTNRDSTGIAVNVTDVNKTAMICGDIRLKQTCLCGPLPNCVWSNSSTSVGPAGTSYCTPGIKTSDQMQLCIPPAQFCEDTKAKNNETMCNDLANNYMMPCKWDNSATPANNCTFNSVAVFGGGGGVMDFNLISGETSCVAAGGSWRSEYYMDGLDFKQDSWCEKGALFNCGTGQGFGNKGNCNSDCWACEFNSTGGNYAGNLTLAQATCLGSAKGVCRWRNDTNAPNRLGWCNYPTEMNFGGAKDCNSDCKACEFFANPSQACSGSPAGCSWANDTSLSSGGFCKSASKRVCSNDCFSCYSQIECSNSTFHTSVNCSWDTGFSLCKPTGFTGEICFNALDDEGDGKTDCADSDCTYDQFCGGGSIGGGTATDCKKKSNRAECRATATSSGVNCTWLTPTWGGNSYCDYPGTDCWMFDSNISACRKDERGCIYRNVTGGYPLGAISKIDSKLFAGFCEINKTKSDICYNASNRDSPVLCSNAGECSWMTDVYSSTGGRCEFKPFAMCGNNTNVASCSAAGLSSWCVWRNNSFSTGSGFCEPKCTGLSAAACSGFCQWKSSICEVEAFGGMETGGMGTGGFGGGGFGCHMNDGNYTSCLNQSMTCAWQNFTMGTMGMGICNEKGAQKMFESMDMGPPKILGQDSADASPLEIDLREYGIKDMEDTLGFGIIVTNITNASVCRGYYIGGGFGSQPILGGGTATTKFYWFLDTNKNITDSCNATTQTGSVLTGYEFLIKYIVSIVNGTVSETKTFHKCSSGNWILTNIPLTSNRNFMCGMSMPGKVGGVMILVDKESMESFSAYNKSAPMRVFASSAYNESSNENSPIDSFSAAGYYTHGSADFRFVDCSNPNIKDDKCKNFQKFGFNVFEDCKNGVDDDGDGLGDCSDPKCTFTPVCSGSSAFSFTANANDKDAPSVAFSNVEVLHNGAFVKFDSNEPANGSLAFYSNDSSCLIANRTISEIGDINVAFDDYKPFHMVPLDDTTLPGFTNGLVNGTTYYYKTSICDPSGNCADSACQNFTTKSENSYKNFILKVKLPPGFNVTIPSLGYSGNFTTTVGSKVYEVGIKTNASITKNINITINCANQSITLVGVDIFKPKSIDMSGAFICGSNSTSSTLGMNSSSKAWNQVVSDLSMGGSGDYIKMTLPVTYSSSNNITWCNDELSNCTNVNSYANCSSGGTGKTDCKIPTSLGFSVYNIATATSDSGGNTPTSSGGGGGGGIAIKKNATSNATTSANAGTTTTTGSEDKETTSAGEQTGGEDGNEISETGAGGFGKLIWIIIGFIAIAGIISALIGMRSIRKKKRGY